VSRAALLRSAALVVLGILAAFVLRDSYFAYLAQLVAVYGILGLSLNLLYGYAGQISLGQAVFFAVGAYGAAILQTRFELSPWIAFPAAVLAAVVLAVLLGRPILRLRGHFLALGTLALGLIAHQVLVAEREWTGGFNGILVSNADTIGPTLTAWLPHLSLVLLALTFIGLELLGRAMPGKAMQMVQSSETVASSLGINVIGYKVWAFAGSAGLAAVAGILFLHVMRIITPGSFGLHTSINILLIVVIGGVGSNAGTIVGAAIFVLLPETLRGFSDYAALLYGVLVLLVLLFAPGGLSGLARSLRERIIARGEPPSRPPMEDAAPDRREPTRARG
jgi:branched-chain amino acid transport system permease protein